MFLFKVFFISPKIRVVNLFLNFVFHFYDAGLQVYRRESRVLFRDDRSFLESSKYFVIRKKKENSSSLFQLLHITDSSPSWDFSLKRCNPEISRVVGTDTPNIKSPNLGFGFWRQNTRFPAKTCKWHYLWFVNFGFNNVNGVYVLLYCFCHTRTYLKIPSISIFR